MLHSWEVNRAGLTGFVWFCVDAEAATLAQNLLWALAVFSSGS